MNYYSAYGIEWTRKNPRPGLGTPLVKRPRFIGADNSPITAFEAKEPLRPLEFEKETK